MKTHIMLDIETLGTRPGDAIIWIGAVKFNAHIGVLSRFDFPVTIESNLARGLKVDGQTVEWWFHLDRTPARDQWVASQKVDLAEALWMFNEWGAVGDPVDGSVWGNGVAMDNVMLQAAYRACGVEWPFSYKQDGCYRTIKNMAPNVKFDRIGTYHNPVDDAETQAQHLITLCQELGLPL